MLFELNNAFHSQAYPIAGFSYVVLNISTHSTVDCCRALELSGFLNSILSLDDPQLFEKYSLCPLTKELQAEVKQTLRQQFACDGDNAFLLYEVGVLPV